MNNIYYPQIEKILMWIPSSDTNVEFYVNYFFFDGELLETWEVGQLLGGN